MELVGGFDGVLPGHGVGHEQDFDRIELLFQLLQFGHQIVVDVQAAGGIDQQHVATAVDGFPAGGADQVGGQLFFGRAGVDGQVDVTGDDTQLLAGSGAVDIDRNHHRAVSVLRKPAGQLAGGGGFAGTLQAHDHDHAGRFVGEAQLGFVAAENLDQFVANDFDDLLGGGEGMQHFFAHRLCLDVFDELLDDAEVDVGFEQGDADFAQGRIHIFGREFAFAAQVFEDPLQLVG